MSPLISIIIPVYNTQPYLSRCIESILSQSYSSFELLLVDDGSTDGSGDICDGYSELDRRIRAYHKENGGVSSARNWGLNFAKGEWVYFVDSDDEVFPDGLQSLANCISEDVDIVMGGFEEVCDNGRCNKVEERVEVTLSKKQSVISLYGGHGSYYQYCGYLWMRLLRRKVIQDNHLVFDPTIAIKEDTLFVMQYICRSKGITRQTTTPVYKYYRRADSAMGRVQQGFSPRYVDSFYALVQMKHEVEALFSSLSEPVFIAEQALVGRYNTIVRMMNMSSVHEDSLKDALYTVLVNEVGSMFLFKVRRKVRNMMRRISVFLS